MDVARLMASNETEPLDLTENFFSPTSAIFAALHLVVTAI